MIGDILRQGINDPTDRSARDKVVHFDRLWEWVANFILTEVDDPGADAHHKSHRRSITTGWRHPTSLRDAQGNLQIYEWLRSKVLYALFPANKATASNVFLLRFLLVS
eukprot:1212623-Prymnesium_polylepis.1